MDRPVCLSCRAAPLAVCTSRRSWKLDCLSSRRGVLVRILVERITNGGAAAVGGYFLVPSAILYVHQIRALGASRTCPTPVVDPVGGAHMRVINLAFLLSVVFSRAQEPRDAAEEHEARAQQQLRDIVQDAIAMLKHGSASAKEQAAGGIANLAIETTVSQPFHPVTFRNACVKAGVVDELVRLLEADEASATAQSRFHALNALQAIATDDPSTELDNGHALAACKAGAVRPVVHYLSSAESNLQVAAAACVAVLAENPECQTMLMKHGAVDPLLKLGSFGGDAAKLRALAALDLLALNNPAAHAAIADRGGKQMLHGLKRFGGEQIREATSDLLAGVESPESLTLAVDTAGHARQAHQARLKHSKVWQSATPMRRAQAPQAQQMMPQAQQGDAE